jgi:HEAT repeat protein
VTDHALEALGRLGARDGRASLLAHTRHRRPETRSRAYAALAQLKDPADAATIAEGLRDSAADVRATSARALGELRASEAAPLLLRALGRGVTEAAPALGKLGDAASVDEFGKYLGKQSLEVMLLGYVNYLQRDDLPEAVKLRIVVALEEISGGVVKRFLSDLLANKKGVRSPKLQRAIIASIARIKVEPATGTTKESSP